MEVTDVSRCKTQGQCSHEDTSGKIRRRTSMIRAAFIAAVFLAFVFALVMVLRLFLVRQSATEESCSSEILKGPPAYNDPRLLTILRREFLFAPEANNEVAPPAAPAASDAWTRTYDEELMNVVRDKVGVPKFFVATRGAPKKLIDALVALGARGLWIEPRPEKSGPLVPSRHPHLWTSHACFARVYSHMNRAGEQCVPLASLLEAFGRPEVDLVLCPHVSPQRVLPSLLTQYRGTVKMVLLKRSNLTEEVAKEFQSHLVAMYSNRYSLIEVSPRT